MPTLPAAALLIPAAGGSVRLGGRHRKPRVLLRGRPLLEWTLEAFAGIPWIRRRAVALHPDDMAWARARWKRWRALGVTDLLEGGATRAESVRRAFEAVVGSAAKPRSAASADLPRLILVHDGARPFVSRTIIEAVGRAALSTGAAVAAIPAADTLKEGTRPTISRARMPLQRGGDRTHDAATKRLGDRATGRNRTEQTLVARTLPRRTPDGGEIWQAQTPQGFRTEVLRRAILADHENTRPGRSRPGTDPTDDAGWVERIGGRVALVTGSILNFKVTTPDDLILARALTREAVGSKRE